MLTSGKEAMPLRRPFLKEAAAEVVFPGSACSSTRLGGRTPAPPTEATVGAHRVRTLDIHAHVIIPEATAMLAA
jgi:hypothetical protein